MSIAKNAGQVSAVAQELPTGRAQIGLTVRAGVATALLRN